MTRSIEMIDTPARIVQLYSPSQDITIADFVLTPNSKHESIIEAIKARFPYRIGQAWPCDINGEPIRTTEHGEVINGKKIDGDPVFNFRYVQNGERLLIAMKQNERILPEPEREVELYLGGDMGQEKYKAMTHQDRRHHLRILRRQEAIQRKNILRLTLPHAAVVEELNKPRYSKAESTRIIQENWKSGQVVPLGVWCLGAWAILSSATCGQPWMVEDVALEKIKARWATDRSNLKEAEVLEIIKELYEEAGATGSTWDSVKGDAETERTVGVPGGDEVEAEEL